MHWRQKEAKELGTPERTRWLQRTTDNLAWLWTKIPGKN